MAKTLEDHLKDKQKQQRHSKLDSFSMCYDGNVLGKSWNWISSEAIPEDRKNMENCCRRRRSRWDVEAFICEDVAKNVRKKKKKKKRKKRKKTGCPVQVSFECEVCGDSSHLTASCPLTASSTGTTGHLPNFFTELGDGSSIFSSSLSTPCSTMPFTANPLAHDGKPQKEIDDTKVYVGYLPPSVNEDRLIELFLPFGRLCQAHGIRDKSTGRSKGYAFVQYTDPLCAYHAISQMHGYRIEGKVLAVRIAGVAPSVSSGYLPAIRRASPSSLSSIVPTSSGTISQIANSACDNSSSLNGKPKKEIDETKRFVGSLPWSVNNDKLIELFLPFGRLCEATILKDKSTGRSKGCGFVQYIDTFCAAQAVAQMNGYKIDGKVICVRIASIPAPIALPAYPVLPVPSCPMSDIANSASGESSSHNKPVKEIDESKLLVSNLPQSLDNDRLIELFLPFGRLCQARVLKDKKTGRSKRCAFVQYSDSVFAAEAVAKMNGYEINGRMLIVGVAYSTPANSQSHHGPANHPGPPISRAPEACPSHFSSHGFQLFTNYFPKQSPAVFSFAAQTERSESPIVYHLTSSSELAQFPGYLKSFQ